MRGHAALRSRATHYRQWHTIQQMPETKMIVSNNAAAAIARSRSGKRLVSAGIAMAAFAGKVRIVACFRASSIRAF